MFEGKYSKLLNILLYVIITAIVGVIVYIGYDFYSKYYLNKDAQKAVEQFDQSITQNVLNQNAEATTDADVAPVMDGSIQTGVGKGGKQTLTYKGFNVVGKIEIPKIKLEYPVLEKTTVKSIEVAVAVLCGPGVNEVGNTVIVGHNYRNGTFFSNNKKLENGDKIYMTDNSGRRLEYVIYNKYTTADSDSDYITRDTNGKREISLSTCTDNVKTRLIIWAKEV